MGCAECLWWVRCCECDGGSCHLNPPNAEGAWPPTQADDFCGQFTAMETGPVPIPDLSRMALPRLTGTITFKPKDDA